MMETEQRQLERTAKQNRNYSFLSRSLVLFAYVVESALWLGLVLFSFLGALGANFLSRPPSSDLVAWRKLIENM